MKALALQVWGPDFKPQDTHKKLNVVVVSIGHSSPATAEWEGETGEALLYAQGVSC